MATSTEICNLALYQVGLGRITDLTTEISEEASRCRAFYNIALHSALSQQSWPFATRVVDLGELENDNTDYSGKYAIPTDCVRIVVVNSGGRYMQSGQFLYADVAPRVTYITKDVTADMFPPNFVIGFAFKLASFLTMPDNRDPASFANASAEFLNDAHASSIRSRDNSKPNYGTEFLASWS